MTTKSIRILLAGALLSTAGVTALAATAEEARQQRMDEAYQNYKDGVATDGPRQPGRFERAENSVKSGMQRAGEAVKRGAEKTGEAIRHGASKTGEAIRHGAEKTGEAVGNGMKKTGDALHRAGEKVEEKTQTAQ